MPSRRVRAVVIVLAIAVLALTGCSRDSNRGLPGTDQATQETSITLPPAPPETIRIAEQFGLAYAPISIVRARGLLESRFPDTRIEWVQLGNAAAIREAMIAGRLDIGFMGIPPFLIGADKGMEWRVFTGLSRSPLDLVTTESTIVELSDITDEHRIAVPQPGSIQHILLSMAAHREFGSADRFDNQLLTLSHPDAMTALLSGAGVSAHFASPPYVFEELSDAGARSILSGRDAFGGPFTFIVGVAAPGFVSDRNTAPILSEIVSVLEQTMQLLEEKDDSAVAELADLYGISAQQLRGYLDHPEMVYATEVKGMDRFISSMKQFGYLTTPDLAAEYLILSGEGLR